jgi:maleylacetoacetate isomerase/maleylpyruvate isomerase
VRLGLLAFEKQLAHSPSGKFCHGDTPGMADCGLVPQIFNAQRFKVDLSGLDKTMSVFDACMAQPAFQQAQPSACPDFEA